MKHTLTVFELLDPEHMTQKSKRLLLTSGNNIRNTEFRGNKSQQGSALFSNNSQPGMLHNTVLIRCHDYHDHLCVLLYRVRKASVCMQKLAIAT